MSFTDDDLAEVFGSITYGELLHLNDADLMQCVSLEAAINICKKSFKHSRDTGNGIFRLWIKRLLNIFEGAKFTASTWQLLTELFEQILREHLSVEDAKPQELMDFLCDALELLKWLRPLVAVMHVICYCLVLCFVLQAIVRFLQFNESLKQQIFGDALQQALALHTFVLQTINENRELLVVADTQEFSQLTNLLNLLSELGALLPDIKIAVETWKCMTNLTTHCVKFSHLANTESVQNKANWVEGPLKLLLQRLQHFLNVIYKEQTIYESMDAVKNYVRLTRLFIQLIERITADFKHENFPCSAQFLDIFALTLYTPKHFQKYLEYFAEYIRNPLNNVFQMIYRNSAIDKLLLHKTQESNALALEYLHVVLIDKNVEYIYDNTSLFLKLFSFLVQDTGNICNSITYNRIITTYAVLCILNDADTLKRSMKDLVLRADFIVGQAAVDVLLTIAHSSCTDSSVLLHEFSYWHKVNAKFSLLTNSRHELHVRLLLCKYFKLCLKSAELTKSALWKKYSDLPLQRSNYRHFMVLGLQNSKEIAKSLSAELLEELRAWKRSCNVKVYYQLVTLITLLTNSDSVNADLMPEILNLVKSLLKNQKNNLKHFVPLIEAAFSFFVAHKETPMNGTIGHIVQTILNRSTECDVTLFLCCFRLLRDTKRNTENEQLLNRLCEEPETKDIAFLYKQKQNTNENYKIDTNLYKQLILQTIPSHCCNHAIQFDDSQTIKRARTELDEQHDDAKFILNEVLSKSQQLVEGATKLDAHDLSVVKRIMLNLKYLTND